MSPKKFLSRPDYAVCVLQVVYNAQSKVLLTLVLDSDLLLFPENNPENIQILDRKWLVRQNANSKPHHSMDKVPHLK